MRLIVCGGAGYIGSHMCKLLAEAGHSVAVVDNLATGHREAVQWGEFHQGDIADSAFLDAVFAKVRPEGVLHFAARSLVGESVEKPSEYYRNNVVATINLLDHVRRVPGCLFIFSSTASIFGIPQAAAIDEEHPCVPINTYGRTKLAIEFVLRDYGKAYDLPSVSFRYFNAAGADPSGAIGESHIPETHLIPTILESALGHRDPFRIFGDDYETPDGTGIRDYIHVNDLCRAHLLGLEYLQRTPGAHFFNLGNGAGFSVKEVIAVTERVIGHALRYETGPRRAGDPPRLVADASLAREALGWTPQYGTLDGIIETAWRWHSARKF
jgi:UDP-glucose 4-epimerase